MSDPWPGREPACPKHMVFGPCGGVRPDGACEVDSDLRCPFTVRPLVRWRLPGPGPDAPHRTADADAPRARRAHGPLTDAALAGTAIVIDLRVRPFDPTSVRSVAGALAPCADALLIGEHTNRPDFPATVMASLVLDAGGHPWPTLSCRDRNRVVLESDVAALAALRAQGVEGLHAVTGDARGVGVRSDATQVFDLDGTRLAALAADSGLCVSVAATPTAPPAGIRARRLVEKQHAGATLAFVNHSGDALAVDAFASAFRDAGGSVPLVACLAVVTDDISAAVLRRFPGLRLDERRVAQILGASDPVEAGITAAVDDAAALLAIEGVGGVNLSGPATGGDEMQAAAILREVVLRLRARLT